MRHDVTVSPDGISRVGSVGVRIPAERGAAGPCLRRCQRRPRPRGAQRPVAVRARVRARELTDPGAHRRACAFADRPRPRTGQRRRPTSTLPRLRRLNEVRRCARPPCATGGHVDRRRATETRPGTQAVERAIAILECFRGDATPLGITEIARAVGLNISTAHRLMRALVAAGFMEQDPVTERYRLGIEIAVLGQRALEQAGYHLAKPVLVAARRGHRRVREPRRAAQPRGRRRRAGRRRRSRCGSTTPPGPRLQLHASGMGKVLLAFGEVGTRGRRWRS